MVMPGNIAKGPLLIRMDKFFEVENRGAAAQFLEDLQNSSDDLVTLDRKYNIIRTDEEEAHLRAHWFGSWWPDLQPVEPIVRHGISTALQVAMYDPDTWERRDLPIDSHWICTSREDIFELYVTWNARQVTLIYNSPPLPHTDYDPPIGKKERIKIVKRVGESTCETEDVKVLSSEQIVVKKIVSEHLRW